MKKLIKKIGNLKFVRIFKSLPLNTRKLLSVGILFALVVALPLFVFAIVNQRFDLRKRAATSEPPSSVCVPINKVITVTPVNGYGDCHDLQEAINSVTSEGFIIKLTPGSYDIWKSVDVTNKQKLTIQGDRNTNSGAVHLEFKSTGFGFHVTNSSGLIEWMDIGGRTANGMLSITNSTDFTVGYVQIYDTSAHTMDVSNSSNISVFNTEIQSSAGALVISSTKGAKILNNKIHNSANAISIYNSSDTDIKYNLIYANRETGISLINLQNSFIIFNTFIDNSQGGNYPTINLYEINGNQGSNYYFANNLVINGKGPGIKAESGLLFTGFTVNDFYGNNPNYSGYPDNTGIGGNISADPLLDVSLGYCLKSGSPAIYGDPSRYEYMGHRGPCSFNPTPTPTDCVQEGGIKPVYLNAPNCCAGLNTIGNSSPTGISNPPLCSHLRGSSICAKCPNEICGLGENYCNCPQDCPLKPTPTPTPSCITEGQPQYSSNQKCCPGLTLAVSQSIVNGKCTGSRFFPICIRCGNGICGAGENICNCPSDCKSTPTPTPIAPCNQQCGGDTPPGAGSCTTGLTCYFPQPNPTGPGVCRNPNCPEKTDCICATGTVNLKLRVKFAGVNNENAEGAKIRLRLRREDDSISLGGAVDVQTEPFPVTYDGSGIYKAEIAIPADLSGTKYAIYVKGEKHLSTKFCYPTGQTQRCPSLNGIITIPSSGTLNLDFTGISLEPGDLPPQDGVVNSNDFQKIKAILTKLTSDITQEDLNTADLNYDGRVNIVDAFLLRKTLETKYDED